MRRHEFYPLLLVFAAILILFVAASACIAVAAPETPQQDGKFLYALGQVGIGYGDATQVIVAGHEVCNLLDAGQSLDQVVDVLVATTSLDRSWSMLFARISIQAFCGWRGDVLRPHRGGDSTRTLGEVS